MSAAEIATQPAVGVRPGRARWKKIALPRPCARRRKFWSSTKSDRRADPRATCGPCSPRAGSAHGAVVARLAASSHQPGSRRIGSQRHAAGGRARPVRAVIAPQQRKAPRRRAAVALALVAHDPRRPERAGNAQRPGDQPAARAPPGRARTRRVRRRAGRGGRDGEDRVGDRDGRLAAVPASRRQAAKSDAPDQAVALLD